jgi:hypothetical protein
MSRDAKKKKPDSAGSPVTLKTVAVTFETALSHQCTSISLSLYLSIYLKKQKLSNEQNLQGAGKGKTQGAPLVSTRRREEPPPG